MEQTYMMSRLTPIVLGLLAATVSSGESQDVKGAVMGKGFRPDVFSLKQLGPASASTNGVVHDRAQTFALTLQEGNDFIPDRSVEIWFNLEVGTKVDGYKVAWRPTEFGTEAHRNQAYRASNKPAQVARGITCVFVNNGPKRESFTDRISLRMAFGKRKGSTIPAAIELVLPGGTRLAGKMIVEIKRS